MKRIIISLFIVTIVLPAQAMQSYESTQDGGGYYPTSQTTKIYSEHGSYQGKIVPQSNGTVKTYDKTGSYTGYFRKDGSKTKYYQANSKK